jgi:tRNA(fMet)-specific endonuclease VapC
MILDSTFLVDFEREQKHQQPGPATRFLELHAETVFSITFTIAGELAAGRSLGADRAKWERFIAPFRLLGYSAEVGWQFGAIHRALRKQGALIGANDLWIAATALANDIPLVTRNTSEFGRVPNLDVNGY